MIYLDSAATSLLKPPETAHAVSDALARFASSGRGIYGPAMDAAETVYRCRETAASLFHLPDPTRVVFTMNATHGLNVAIRSVVRSGMRVLVSGYEHNAVVRPLAALGAEMLIVDTPPFDTQAFLRGFEKKLDKADAVVVTHVSNVFGFILPVREISALCGKRGIPWILDAAQSAGSLPVDFTALGAEFIAMPGHKGLLGPQGTGLLLCRGDAEPLLYGGTGSMSDSLSMPEFLPDRLEAGTQNVCGIAGLLAGMEYVQRRGVDQIRAREGRLSRTLIRELEQLGTLRVISGPEQNQAGVLSVIPVRGSCEELASRLWEQGVAVRSGLHCAPLAHETAGTKKTGTVRLSVSPFNTEAEIYETVRIIKKITQNYYIL